MKKLYSLIFTLFLLSQAILAQNCVISTATNKVCLGNTLLFNVSFDAGLTATSYSWNFGNSATSTQSAPVYQYPSLGSFIPSVTITFSNNTNCTVNGQAITVVANPIANYSVTSQDTQCFKGNNFCITDLSTPGPSSAALTSRFILWGDGGFDNSPPGINPVCHSYTNPLGGAFPIVLEVTDANGCVARKEVQNAAVLWPKMQEISFTTNFTIQCNQTPVTFTNTSKIPQSMVSSYLWEFGDGTFATTPWSNFVKTYTQSGYFDAKLYVTDVFGCKDTFTLPNAGANAKINDSIFIIGGSGTCYTNGFFDFYQKNVNDATIRWSTYDAAGAIIDTLFLKNPRITFKTCGRYKVSMFVYLGNCFARKDTFVDVYGPDAVAETRDDRFINSIQCEIHDTVIFRTPVKETSCYHKNLNMFYLWDFGDQFAPPCTTDTRNNINVGINCRYSKDTFNVKHRYYDTKEQCYTAKLIMTDLVRGCTDTSEASLKLTPPNAGWDSTSTPIRQGLRYIASPAPCFDNPIIFNLDKTLPLCGRELAWINIDSACGKNNWLQLDSFAGTYSHTYSTTCNPSGWVTVGLIIKNGKDKNGNPCYDTAWYHHMFRLININPTFSAFNTTPGCGPWNIKITPNDTTQENITKAEYWFNGDSIITYNVPPGDSIIPIRSYTFKTAGIKRIVLTLTNTQGCSRTFQQFVYLGFSKSFSVSKSIMCLGDSVQLIDNIKYWGSTNSHWRDSLRVLNNKETIIWDIGDGNGFSKTGPIPFIKYSKVANYPVRMIAIDSLGCRDTIKTPLVVRVIDVDAKIAPMLPRYLCSPQILTFTDQSIYSDSSALYSQLPYDKVTIWRWEFDDGKPNSLLKNPVHDFTSNGTFNVKLYVETGLGCKDSTYSSIFIDGPKPRFNIVGDTVGCAPFTVKLDNTTGYQLQNWIWFFRDQNGNTLSTLKDTSVTFTYTKGGVYKIYLLGEDTIFNQTTMQYKTCQAVFPDSLNINAPIRQVRVIDRIGSTIIGPDSVCLFQPFTLTARSTNLFAGNKWFFGNGDSANKIWPDTSVTYSYKQTGTYKVKLVPMGGPAGFCIDTATKDIKVSSIVADFDLDETKSPVVSLTNKSSFAVRYEWNFGQPSSGSKNFSELENPSHNYGADTGIFTICLKAFNIDDCFDSICKQTSPKVKLIVPNVFTPNRDGINDAYDIDIQGYTFYHLTIYNRWGNKVYEGKTDGIGNDGNNWNGRNFNTGSECPEGVYYYIFRYQLLTMNSEDEMHGSVTLIRD